MILRLARNFAVLVAASCPAISVSGEAKAAIDCISPPVLSNPLSYVGKCPGESGFPTAIKAGGRDVYISLPTNKTCANGLSVGYAGNIRITGGHFVFNGGAKAVITIRDSSGVTFIDGLYIDVNRKYADAIRAFNHKGSLIVQNTFVKGISGTRYGVHGDLVHPQGGGPLQELSLQNVTGYTGYQGLFTPYRPSNGHGTRKLRLDRVNVAYDPDVTQRSLKLLYFGNDNNSTDMVPDLGSTFSGVYVDGSYWGLPYYRTVLPEPVPASSCASFEARHLVNGQVCDGRPVGGDYVPPSQVGQNYDRSYFCSSSNDTGDSGSDTGDSGSGTGDSGSGTGDSGSGTGDSGSGTGDSGTPGQTIIEAGPTAETLIATDAQDRFVFDTVSDSTRGARDYIVGIDPDDIVDLSALGFNQLIFSGQPGSGRLLVRVIGEGENWEFTLLTGGWGGSDFELGIRAKDFDVRQVLY